MLIRSGTSVRGLKGLTAKCKPGEPPAVAGVQCRCQACAVSMSTRGHHTAAGRTAPLFYHCKHTCSSCSPVRIAACTAAPWATASSGSIDLHSSLPLKNSCGMRVET